MNKWSQTRKVQILLRIKNVVSKMLWHKLADFPAVQGNQLGKSCIFCYSVLQQKLTTSLLQTNDLKFTSGSFKNGKKIYNASFIACVENNIARCKT